jgi:hypothetical protein
MYNIPRKDIENFLKNELLETAGVMRFLNCSRQNIDQLVKRGKLTPILTLSKTKIFLKSDISAYKSQK